MSAAIIGLIFVAAMLVLGSIYLHADARGYAAGQQAERGVVDKAADELQRHHVAAQRDIDYLYEQAKWQITGADPDE